ADPLDRALGAAALRVDVRGGRRGRAVLAVPALRGIVVHLARQLLVALLVVPELILELLTPLLELGALLVLLAAGPVPHHLGLPLLDDHRRAPRRLLLRAEDVAIDVIADVQDAIARHADRGLEVVEVAALVHRAALERQRRRPEIVALAAQERPLLLEERRL